MKGEIDESQGQLMVIKTEEQNLEQRKIILEDELASLQEIKRDLDKEIKESIKKRDLLPAEFEKILVEIEDAKQKLKTLNSQIQSLTSTKMEIEAEVKQLNALRERLKQDLVRPERERIDIPETEGKLREAERKHEKLKSSIIELQEQKIQYETEIVQLQDTRQRFQDEIVRLKKGLSEAKAQLEEVQVNSKATIQEREAEIQLLNEKIEELIEIKKQREIEVQGFQEQEKRLGVDIKKFIKDREALIEQLGQMKREILETESQLCKLRAILQKLEEQRALFEQDISTLQKQKEELAGEVAELEGKKREVERVPIDSKVLEKAREAAEGVPSIYLRRKEDKARAVNTLVELIRIKSSSGEEEGIRKELKEILVSLGGRVLLLEENNPKNLVVEFPATEGLVGKQAIILNVHMDTIPNSMPEDMDFKEGEFYHRGGGSFGADDKAGITVIVEALRILKERWWDNGFGHSRVIVILQLKRRLVRMVQNI